MSPAAFIDDPGWADFLPEVREPARKRHLPSHEDCSLLDVESVASHLRSGGTLGRMSGYEERPGQLDMLRGVARAFNSRGHLMVEAGTGVGKSLAYLLPSMLWAWTNDTPVVVSTATRNLQSQLLDSDIPRARAALGDGADGFKVALLKGRANYLCLRAVSEFFAAGFWTMSKEEQDEMPRFIEWLKTTPDGDLDRYDGLPRGLLTCPGEECGGRRCRFHSRCFVYRARKAAAEAHLVVVNHSLVLAEAIGGGGAILPSYGRLVLDEAHNLEEIATDCLGGEFSLPELTRLTNRLLRRGRRRRVGSMGGILASVDNQLQKGAFGGGAAAELLRSLLLEAPPLVANALAAAEAVFSVAEAMLAPAKGDGPLRYRVQDGRRAHSVGGLFKAYGDDWDEARLLSAQGRMDEALAALVGVLHRMRDALASEDQGGGFDRCADLAAQLDGVAESLVAFANEANFVLRGERDTHAYWIERVRQEKRHSHLRLVAAPLSVAEDLKKLLYDAKDSVVLCSATLRVGNDFKYMARRLGCQERFETLNAVSPFNYLAQSLVLAPDCLPDPSADPGGYAAALAETMRGIFAATGGRALALFTSYEMMNAVAGLARGPLAEAGIRLLVQGEGLSRESMTHALKSSSAPGTSSAPPSASTSAEGVKAPSSPTVLFGAQSFWEGVDVAGEALSCVVIARLPFAMVGDPVVEARSEKIDRDGGSSFRDYALPEAVIRFRQGFGRLIRTKRDRGVVVVTDPRIVTKGYGAVFRRSIPASVHTVADREELLRRVEEFFAI